MVDPAVVLRWVVLGIWLAASVARADDPRRALLLGPIDDSMLERVRGQTSDLPWSLEVIDAPRSTDSFARALELGRARGAEVVVWIDADGGARIVSVVEVAERRLFARRIDAEPGEALGLSAIAEASALVIRGALADLAIGGHLGIVVPPAEPAPAPDPAPMPPSPVSTSTARLRATIAAAIAIDGTPGRAHLGPAVRIAVEIDLVELGIEGRFAPAESLDAPGLSISVTRYALRGGIAFQLFESPEWRATLGVGLGLVAHERSTEARDSALEATSPSTVATFAASGEAHLQWTPFAGGAVGLDLALGADVLAIAPRWTIERAGGAEVVHAPWPVQPTIALGLTIRAP